MGTAEIRNTRWFRQRERSRVRQPGPTARAVEDRLASAAIDPIRAELARDAADLVDSARRQQDPRLWSSAADRLLKYLGGSGERAGQSRADGDQAAGDDGGGVAGIFGAGPALGDAEDAE